jgi:L-alanine-DL-glutamate epimerase-like enolase superfamily enzyme
MRITAIDTFRVPPGRPFVKVSTDEGIVGWGEVTLEGWAGSAEGAFEVAALREVGLAVSFHGRVHRAMAKELLGVHEPLRPLPGSRDRARRGRHHGRGAAPLAQLRLAPAGRGTGRVVGQRAEHGC